MEIVITAAIVVIALIIGYLMGRKKEGGARMERDAHNVDCQSDEVENASFDSANESNDGTQYDSEESMKEEKDGGKPDIRDLMVEILRNLGCQPTKEENDSVYVSYQGGRLHMIFDGMDVIIWEPFWCRIKVDDPNLPIAQKAVNAANFISGPAVVMTAPDEEGFIIFRSRRDIMLHPACPDNESFVRTVLESFFKKKIDVYHYYQKFVAEQREPQENCRKSDFTKDMNPN